VTGRRPARPYRRPRPDPVRRVAFDLLRAVAERDAYANLVLPGLLRERGVTGRDAAFATELAYGTLRWRGTYDAVLATCVDRPLDSVDPPVLDLLRLGSHQLLGMRVPDHAAVAATVELARAVAGEGRASFVNAVLRSVARQDLPAWVTQVAPDRARDPAAHLAVATSHPRWIVDAVHDRLGTWDETEAMLRADDEPPQVTLVARPGRTDVAALLASGAVPGRWSPYAAVLEHGDPAELPQVRSGAAGVQDEGSQLAALAAARAPLDGGVDVRWLDLCAGPGGKSALLAGLAGERGAALLAVELQPHRAALVARTLAGGADAGWRTGLVVADGRAGPWRPGSFDRVLVDVPCTGLGALRRRPEARWRRRPSDVAGLGPLQRGLLVAAADAVRPGGVVAYVTCSPHVAETESVVRDVRAARSDLEALDARELLPEVDHLGAGPAVQLWPHVHGTDAMFVCLLRRTG
jgi:16S rRNA (cytosine967-C5)-methyltransferase